jgi:hypothetical protein
MLKRPITRLEFAIVLVLLIGAGLYAVQVNALYDFIEIAAPANPAANNDRLYANSGTHQLACLTSSGGSCMPSGGGGGSFIQTLTAPVSGNFTARNFNTGAGVVTTQTNNSTPVTSITLAQSDPSGTKNLVALSKNTINALFTVTIAVSIAGNPLTKSLSGLWLSDGGAGPNNLVFGVLSADNGAIGWNYLVSEVYSNFVTFSFDAFVGFSGPGFGPLVWLRVQETLTNRIYSVSSDGINFVSVLTEAVAAHFTTAQYGFATKTTGLGGNNEITMYSFAESTP